MNHCYNRAGGAATRLYESSSVSSAISLYYNSDGETHAERETENAPVELVICCAARSAGSRAVFKLSHIWKAIYLISMRPWICADFVGIDVLSFFHAVLEQDASFIRSAVFLDLSRLYPRRAVRRFKNSRYLQLTRSCMVARQAPLPKYKIRCQEQR